MGWLSSKIVSNSLWMMLEKLVSMMGLILVNSYMAKYVGPEIYGKIVFVGTLFIFVQSLAWLGAQNVYFKRMSENKVSGFNFAYANLWFRRFLFVFCSVLLLSYLYITYDIVVFVFGMASFIASYYIISDFVSIYNNSQLKSYINALTNIVGLVIALLTRFLLVHFEAHVYYLTFPIILVVLVPYLLRYFLFKKEPLTLYAKTRKHIRKYNHYLINTGGALLLSSLSIVTYNQISNLFLVKYASFADLGIYNIAMTIGGAWAFVNIALITSFFSKIYAEKNKEKVLDLFRLINYMVICVGIVVSITLAIIGQWSISFLYGSAFLPAVPLLPLVVIATLFSNMGTICYRSMIKFGGYKYLSIKMLVICTLSIPLSHWMIKYYGILGAAYCFILVEFISLTIGNYFFNKGQILKMQLTLLQLHKFRFLMSKE